MTVKLIGTDSVAGSPAGNVNYAFGARWAASQSGQVTTFRVYANVTTTVKVGIYTGDDYPQTRIAVQNTEQTIVTNQWNDITLSSPVNVTQGVKYWLIVLANIYAPCRNGSETGTPWQYRAYTYSSGLPATFDSSWNTVDNTYMSTAAYGNAVQLIAPFSISQSLAYGTPTVLTLAQIIYPSSVVQATVSGTPLLFYPQTLSPPSISQPVFVGGPWVGIFGFVKPAGIAQQISSGNPTLYKYVWHVILDGQYASETPRINRTYIIGKDQYGNPVYGSAIESSEVDLVGERLDFQQEIAVPTESQAAGMASAILAKMRLTKARGVILIPPNCGQELFDVVQISDSGANQPAVKFRVVGIRFEYNPGEALYLHKLVLGAP